MPGVAYPGVWDNRSTINAKTGYDDDDDWSKIVIFSYPLAFDAPVQGIPVIILPSRLACKTRMVVLTDGKKV